MRHSCGIVNHADCVLGQLEVGAQLHEAQVVTHAGHHQEVVDVVKRKEVDGDRKGHGLKKDGGNRVQKEATATEHKVGLDGNGRKKHPFRVLLVVGTDFL